MIVLPGKRDDTLLAQYADELDVQDSPDAARSLDPAANDNGANALDIAGVSEQLERLKRDALHAADEDERVRRLDDAAAFFGRLPAAQIDEAQVQDWRRSWVQDFAESHIRMLAPQQAIDLLQPRAVPQQSAQTNSLEAPAQPAPETQANSSFGDFLPDERKSVLLQDARHRHALERVSAAIERGNMLERQISEAAERGDFSALPPEKTIAEAADLSAFERSNLLALHRKAAQQLATLHRAMERFADPASRPFDPFDANDRAEVDALYRKLGANPEALAAVFRRTGLVPQSAIASFRDELGSNDPARVQAAAENLSGMLERNPDALTGIVGGSDIEDTALAYRYFIEDLGLAKEAASVALLELRVEKREDKAAGVRPAVDESADELSSSNKKSGPRRGKFGFIRELLDLLKRNPELAQIERIAPPKVTPEELLSASPDGSHFIRARDGQRFLAAPNGTADLATLPPIGDVGDVAPIRLQRAIIRHIDDALHREDAIELGYRDGVHLTLDVVENWTTLHKGSGDRIVLARKLNGDNAVVVTELERADQADYWRIVTAGVRRSDQLGEALRVRVRTPESRPGNPTPSRNRTTN